MGRGPQRYAGFEQGPIRPPSEAHSLLIRVTRNCPWNRCTFCPVYKGNRFSLRPVDHVLRDIDAVHACVVRLQALHERQGLPAEVPSRDPAALAAASHWVAAGMQAIFLQDANSLILPPDRLTTILRHLKTRFPQVARITSYARSHTVARMRAEDLRSLADAGLNRIHIGMESGCDDVLRRVAKGATQEQHIAAGRKVKAAGIALSEYVMPGLGGEALSTRHALESAAALNRIDPDFIRLRTLAIPAGIPLHDEWTTGRFHKLTDATTVREVRTFIAALDGIGSTVVSDHILNLLQEVDGRLPEDRERMLAHLDRFLALDPQQRCLFQVGRRLGVFARLDDLARPRRVARVAEACREWNITPDNVDRTIDALMQRFI